MNNISSFFKWEKEYLYINKKGQVSTLTLNFFQRGFRFLGLYADTRLSSIAKACLEPRIWREDDLKKIYLLINKVGSLPIVKWIEKVGDNQTNVSCKLSCKGYQFTIESLKFKHSISLVPFENGLAFGEGHGQGNKATSITPMLLKYAANSMQLKNLFWDDRLDTLPFTIDAWECKYKDIEESNIEINNFSAPLYSARDIALYSKSPFSNKYALDFFHKKINPLIPWN